MANLRLCCTAYCFQCAVLSDAHTSDACGSLCHCDSTAVAIPGKLFLTIAICKNEKSISTRYAFRSYEADYGARTRHLDLGKVALYQMS